MVVKILRTIIILTFIIGILVGDAFAKLVLAVLLWITLIGIDEIIE